MDMTPALTTVQPGIESPGWPGGRPDPSMLELDRSRDALLTDFGKTTLERSYLMPGESYQDNFARVAAAGADGPAHAQRLYDYMSRHWFMPATPVLSNLGTDRGLPISCFLNEVEDSMEGIQATLNENWWLAAKGGGIGTYWGNVRSTGERVKNNGKTSGPIPFIVVMDAQSLAVSQGDLRRGSAAIYMQMSHPDIEEFIEIRRATGGDPNRKAKNLHHGVVIPDAFMEAVEAGSDWALVSPKTGEPVLDKEGRPSTVKARDLWVRLLTARMETGEPYMLFSDTVAKSQPLHHKLAGLKVKTSNLCVAPETMLLTRDGHRPIASLADRKVEVWNGERWSETTVRKTGVGQRLIRVNLDSGVSLDVTPYHKFYVQRTRQSSAPLEVRAADLEPGQRLIKFDLPEAFGGAAEAGFAYAHGFFCGDGTYTGKNRDRQDLRLYGEKKLLVGRLRESVAMIGTGQEDALGRLNYTVKTPMPAKFEVPMDYSVRHKLEWLAGFADADGTVAYGQGSENLSVQLCSSEPEFLRSVQLMLQTLGVASRVRVSHEARQAVMPNGRGGQGVYECRQTERLFIASGGVARLAALGWRPSRLELGALSPRREATRFVRVESVEDLGRVDDTYCVTEPLRNMAVFNGVLTGNCVEITLPTGPDHLGKDRTAVCCLSSLNLEYWDSWHSDPQFVPDVMRFLDNVLQNFIDSAPPSMARAVYAASRERSVGMGVMGFHSFLQSRGVPYEGVMAGVWNRRMFKHIRAEADRASAELAAERGACPDAADFGVLERFSHKVAVAPTASISIIAGTTSPGVETIAANAFLQKTLSGSFIVRNRHLEAILKGLGRNTFEVWSDIVQRKGSVQHLDFLTDEQKAVFRTSFEIDHRWTVEHAAARAGHICQSQSVNIFLPGDVHKVDLHDIHFSAWRKGVKSLYYCRSMGVSRAEGSAQAADKAAARGAAEGPPKYEECLSCQ